MNVAFDPWIPVITLEGKKQIGSLNEVLTNGSQYADLAVRPHERVSLMRLFVCAAHAALNGPQNHEEWRKVTNVLPEAVHDYLKKWKESFELFHQKRPWLQVAGISYTRGGKEENDNGNGWTPVSKLNFSFATGGNSTLFDHDGMNDNREIRIEETILSMLTFQCFSPGGLISQVYWNGKQTEKSSKDSPCSPSSMLHALVRGKTLSETIRSNLPTYNDIQLLYVQDVGKPIWEMVPASFDDSKAITNATKTYLGRLVPMTRLICLHPSGSRMLLGDGLVYPKFDEFPAEPTATVVSRKSENGDEVRVVLSYKPSKGIWRELSAIVVKRNAQKLGGPLALHSLQEGEECDIIVAALKRDQAKIVDTTESVYHIPSKLRSDTGIAVYEDETKKAEKQASRLGWAVETYREEIDDYWKGRLKSAGPKKGELKKQLHSIATIHYWTTVEQNLSLLMAHIEAIGSESAIPTRAAWRKMLFKTSIEAYEIACGRETPRQMRAFAKGRQKLTGEKEETTLAADDTKEVSS